jgi:hypothetical protein
MEGAFGTNTRPNKLTGRRRHLTPTRCPLTWAFGWRGRTRTCNLLIQRRLVNVAAHRWASYSVAFVLVRGQYRRGGCDTLRRVSTARHRIVGWAVGFLSTLQAGLPAVQASATGHPVVATSPVAQAPSCCLPNLSYTPGSSEVTCRRVSLRAEAQTACEDGTKTPLDSSAAASGSTSGPGADVSQPR